MIAGLSKDESQPILFIRAVLAGVVCAAVELALFWLLSPRPAAMFVRIVTCGLNYWLIRNWVFRSGEPVRATLPRYLALAAAAALASTTGIRALTAGLSWNPIAAKAAVDALLFFANFAIQRLLIFTGDESVSLPRRYRDLLAVALAGALLVGAGVAEVYGFVSQQLFTQMVWMPWGLHRFTHFAGLFAACSFVVLLFAPWGYAPLAPALLTAATVLAVGPLPVLSVALFVLASYALGSLICGRSSDGERSVVATLLGAAIYVFAFTVVARIPINTPLVWFAALVAPIAVNNRAVFAAAGDAVDALRCLELRTWPERLAFALLVLVVTIQWAGAIAPETSADGLSVHLAIPANIAAHHALTFEPRDFVWAVMPLAGDFAYSIVYLFGGEAAPSLLNFAMLLAIAALLYCACRRCVERPTAFLLTALFVATPLVQLVTGSLFVENFVAALALGALAACWRYAESGDRRLFLAAAILAGAAIAAKVGMWAIVLIAAPFAIADARRRDLPRSNAWLAAVLLVATAIPPYAIAYIKTGNPLFPFLNDKIPSAALPHGVFIGQDARYSQPLTVFTPFDLTFRTHDFFESQDGGVGFAWLLLIPLAALALFVMRSRRAVIAASVALGGGALIFLSRPNARYLYAVMPLFIIAFAGMLDWLRERRRLRAALIGFTVAVSALNIYFIPSSSWYRKDFYSPLFFRAGGREQYLKDNHPTRYLARQFRRQHPADHLLEIGEVDLADIGDGAYEYLWHQWPVFYAISNAQRVTDLRRVLARFEIHYVSYSIPNEDEDLIQPSSLREYLANCARPILQDGRFYVAHIDPRCETLSDADLESEIARFPAPVMAAGTYDDFHFAILFHGEWIHSRYFAEPYRHTISYTDVTDAAARFAFAGDSLSYVHTNAPNRGIAELTIDGAVHEIDCYSKSIEWQSRTDFDHLGAGQHLVTLRASGRANPGAMGKFIDLDAFIAR